MAVSARMTCLIRVYTVSIAIHLDGSGVHLRAARTCRARFSCREYVLWHCVHTCITGDRVSAYAFRTCVDGSRGVA